MKAYLLLIVFATTMSCKKNDYSPDVHFNVEVIGSAGKLRFEELKGEWNPNNNVAKIEAVSFDFHRINLNLNNISDTGIIQNFSINNLELTDAKGFSATNILGGQIRIILRDKAKIAGELDLILEGNNQQSNIKRIVGDFLINN